MNLETSVIKIIEGSGIIDKSRQLPFKKPTETCRKEETCRPIFWANNYKSYIDKTKMWDEFPNGRWGASRSAAFAAEEGGFQSYSRKIKKLDADHEKSRKLYGQAMTCYNNVAKVFVDFITGKIKKMPFSNDPMTAEAAFIEETLIACCKNKLLTINSQPRVNGVRSNDKIFGWGPDKGFIY
jgi:methylenetetrahydrofolate reductase (NADPH)